MTIFFHSSILPSGEFMRKRRKKGQVGDQKESLNPWKNIVIEINLHISPLSPLHMQNEWREEEEEEEENSNTPQRPLNPEQLCVLAPERRTSLPPLSLFPCVMRQPTPLSDICVKYIATKLASLSGSKSIHNIFWFLCWLDSVKVDIN